MKYVLDTNVVSRVLDGDERALGVLAAVEPQDVGIPLLVLAELVFGTEKSARREENRKFLHADLSPDHWLFDSEQRELCGIIDFGDCVLGDPDYEYTYLLQDCGEPFTRLVLENQGARDIEGKLRKLRYLVTFDHAKGVLASERYGKPEHREECLAALRAESEP